MTINRIRLLLESIYFKKLNLYVGVTYVVIFSLAVADDFSAHLLKSNFQTQFFYIGSLVIFLISLGLFVSGKQTSVYVYWLFIIFITLAGGEYTFWAYSFILYFPVLAFASTTKQNIGTLLVQILFLGTYAIQGTSFSEIILSALAQLALCFCLPVILRVVLENQQLNFREHTAALKAEQQKTLEIKEELARELHDVVARELTLITMRSDVALKNEHNTDEQRQDFSGIGDESRKALAELRRLVHALRAQQTDVQAVPQKPSANVDITGTIDRLRQDFTAAGLTLETQIIGDLERIPIGILPTLEISLSEAGTNALRYATAHEPVKLSLVVAEEELVLSTKNTYVPQKSIGSGMGLVGMRERAKSLGGELDAGEVTPGTWQLVLAIPFEVPII